MKSSILWSLYRGILCLGHFAALNWGAFIFPKHNRCKDWQPPQSCVRHILQQAGDTKYIKVL